MAEKKDYYIYQKSQMKRVKNVEDVLHVGDKVTVKVIEIDDQDRINLTMKDL